MKLKLLVWRGAACSRGLCKANLLNRTGVLKLTDPLLICMYGTMPHWLSWFSELAVRTM